MGFMAEGMKVGALTAGFACGEQGELTGISISGVARQQLCAVRWDFLREAVPCPAHMPPRAIAAREERGNRGWFRHAALPSPCD